MRGILLSLDKELLEEWPIWRLIVEDMATLKDLHETWSLSDVEKANIILDVKAEVQNVTLKENVKNG